MRREFARTMTIRFRIVDETVHSVLAASRLRAYSDFVDCPLGETVATSSTTQTRKLALPACDGVLECFLKVYRYAGRSWRHRFRRDKAAVEVENYETMRHRCGIAVPDVLAHGSRRAGLRLLDAFLLTRAVRDASPLSALAATAWPNPNRLASDQLRDDLLERTADLVGQMHGRGFYHVDLQWRNLLIAQRRTAAPRIIVLDAPRGGVRLWRPRRLHGQLRDLSSLYKEARIRLRRTEQMRWLHRYASVSAALGAPDTEVRRLARAVVYDRRLKDNPPSA